VPCVNEAEELHPTPTPSPVVDSYVERTVHSHVHRNSLLKFISVTVVEFEGGNLSSSYNLECFTRFLNTIHGIHLIKQYDNLDFNIQKVYLTTNNTDNIGKIIMALLVAYCFRRNSKSPQLAILLSQVNIAYTLTPFSIKTNFNIIFQLISLSP
jgi:hypothetical protein